MLAAKAVHAKRERAVKRERVRTRNTVPKSTSSPEKDQWPPPGAVQQGPYTLAAGDYWIGDLGNVLKYDAWKEIGTSYGHQTLSDGREVVRFKLPCGNGIYPGKDGHNHFIDSGTIGITLLDGLGVEARSTGQISIYSDKFECSSITVAHPQGGGNVSFNTFGGNVEIDSDDEVYVMTPLLREARAAHKNATRLRAYGHRITKNQYTTY